MNEKARKQARRAELEHKLFWVYFLYNKHSKGFASWLEFQAGLDGFHAGSFEDEAKELIALYEGE